MNPDRVDLVTGAISRVDLVTGAISSGIFCNTVRAVAEKYSDIPFPGGRKANILGVDLNLQYPAHWEKAREIKRKQGFSVPAPRDWVETGARSAPESRALWLFTKK